MAEHLRNRRLIGAYLVGATMFFGWMGLFTYLPYLLSAPPFSLSTGPVSSVFLVYAVGVLVSPLAGRLSTRVAPTRLVAIGLTVEAIGLLATLHAALRHHHRGAAAGGGRDLHGAGGGARLRQPAGAPAPRAAPAPST